MGVLSNIKEDLQTRLQALQYSSNPAFTEVKKYGSQKFTGYPSATVVASAVNNEYDTQKQNNREYVVFIRAFFNLENIDDEAQYVIADNYTDLILDAIDDSEDLNGLCDFVEPTVAEEPRPIIDEAGSTLMITIRVSCRATHDIE